MSFNNNSKKTFTFSNVKTFFCVFALFFLCQNQVALAMEQEETFLISKDYDFYNRSQVQSFLAFESDNAYFYFEKDYYERLSASEKNILLSQVRVLGEKFDSIIYPTTKEIFGDEWNPGIDADEKVLILFSRMEYNVGGYFNPNDEYLKSQVVDDNSNEHEIIYLNPDFLSSGKIEGFLAHELQHMIYWNEKSRIEGVTEEIWINEARSELASAIIEEKINNEFSSGTLAIRKRDFLTDYSDSLVDWNNSNYDYASVSVFMQYIKDKFGTNVFQQMNSGKKTGAYNLSYALEKEEGTSLAQIFTDWTLANYINDTSLNPKYGYDNINLKDSFNVVPKLIYDKDGDNKINLEGELDNWSANYYKIDFSKITSDLYIQVSFDGNDSGFFALPMVINYKDGSRKVEFFSMDKKQTNSKDLISQEGKISSVVLIPASENMNSTLTKNQAKSYDFAINISFMSTEEKIRTDGNLIKLLDNEKVYLVEDGTKKWIEDSATFIIRGYDWDKIEIVTEVEFSLYPEGNSIKNETTAARIGSLIKGSGPKIYLLENDQRRWIKDEQTFVFLGFNWSDVASLSDQELFLYKEGETLSKGIIADGSLVKASGPQVYLIENGKKRWITSPEAFSRNKFIWSSIIETSEDDLLFYDNGLNID